MIYISCFAFLTVFLLSTVNSSFAVDLPQIAFSTKINGVFERFIVNVNGTGLMHIDESPILVTGPSEYIWPYRAPDKTRSIELRFDSGAPSVYLVGEDGSEEFFFGKISSGLPDHRWSPDSQKIAYTSGNTGQRSIRVLDVINMEDKVISDSIIDAHFPSWNPEGNQIVFMAKENDNEEIYISNVDGTSIRNLTNHPGRDFFDSWQPGGAWSANQSKIVYISDRDGRNDIFVMDTNGGNQRNLTSSDASDVSPVWSPDGSMIVYRSIRNEISSIRVVGSDGSNTVNITGDSGDNQSPFWVEALTDLTAIVGSSWATIKLQLE